MRYRVLAVDANVLFAALLRGRAALVFRDAPLGFLTTEVTVWETRKYFPLIAAKINRSEEQLLRTLEDLPIKTVPGYRYRHALPTALSLIGQRDPKDAEIVALALALGVAVWSNDKDFDGLPGVTRVTTEQLLREREAGGAP